MIDLSHLNEPQKEAVLTTEGPLLVLAGAGSGKTRVLTHRIAHLIKNKGVAPGSVLAITFTNKAAEEMRVRLASQLGPVVSTMWIYTFHAFCVRILRAHAEKLGFKSTFSIYDADDSKRLITECIRNERLDTDQWTPARVQGIISAAKNELKGPRAFRDQAETTNERMVAPVYEEYQRRLSAANAMDFDDLLMLAFKLLNEHDEVRKAYSLMFQYIHVDEYQDTNHAQYRITNLLASEHKNLMVVGDDDQSIYSWRGADISNILEFERDYPEAKVIKLEQNYRSTQVILDAANAVISHNTGRKPKKLFTEVEGGDKIAFYRATTEIDEARYVASEIERLVAGGKHLYSDVAVFYRTNAQSRVVEDAFLRAGIPYRLVGGTKYFDRAEIRDLMAYLKITVNPSDDIAMKRIINTPRRKIGKKTTDTIEDIAYRERISFNDAMYKALGDSSLGSAAKNALQGFIDIVESIARLEGTLEEIVEEIIAQSNLLRALELERTTEAQTRAENVREFLSVVKDFAEDHESATLADFSEWLALRSDLDSLAYGDDSVVLMTVHSAKGLEFPIVFVIGLEEEIFPHRNSMFDPNKLEEERRLAYVAFTRAREELYLSCAVQRTVFGRASANLQSCFLKEIPEELLDYKNIGSKDFFGLGFDKRGDRSGSYSYGGGYGSGTRYESGRGGFSTSSYQGGVGTYAGPYGEEPSTSRATATNSTFAFASQKPKKEERFVKGDRVHHKTFGNGEVIDVEGDSLTIRFDNSSGTRRLVFGYAPLKKLE